MDMALTVARYFSGQVALASLGLGAEAPGAFLDCWGAPKEWHERLVKHEGIKLAALDTIQLRMQYALPQRMGWRIGYDMMRNVPDYLDPHWCAAVVP